MKKINTFEEMKAEVDALLAAPMCCKELKAAAEKWLASLGTENQEEAADEFIDELLEDVNSIDDTIGFFGSKQAKLAFGEEEAAKRLEALKQAKAAGEEYCTCPACQAGAAIMLSQSLLYPQE